MIAALIEKEGRALFRDGRLLALGLAVLVLGIGVLWVSHLERERREDEKQRLERAMREQWDTQGEKHPHRGAHFGLYVFAPQSALSAFDPGVQKHFGDSIYLEPHRRNVSRLSEVENDIMRGRFGEFTPAFVLISILPLLIVTALHSSLAGERESGVLRMVASTGARMPVVVRSKLIAVLLAVAAIVIPIFFTLMMVSGELLRTATLAVAYLAYCTIFIAVALAASARSRTARNALMLLMALWLTLIWIVPRAGASLASSVVELPSADTFWAAIRQDYQQGLPGDGDLATRNRVFDEQLLAEHNADKLQDLPFGAYAIRRLNRDRYADRVHELHFQRLWNAFEQQERILRGASALSPAIAVRHASMKLTGTDLQHRRAFEDAAERYRQYFNEHIDQWDAENTVGLRSFEDKYGHNALWRSIRPFQYCAPSPQEAVLSALPELGILGAWTIAAIALLTFVTRKVSL